MNPLLWHILAGLLSGLLCACGGAIKDAPYEGFKLATFFRSPIVGAACGAITSLFADSFVVAFLCAGYFERICVEGWKIVRVKMPGKFENGEWGAPRPLKTTGRDW